MTTGRRAATGLRAIPGVGPSIEADLVALGITGVDALRGQDPEALYARLCAREGTHVDRCVLYVFRCAVYWAESESPDPELSKWWAWKDAADPPLGLLGHAR